MTAEQPRIVLLCPFSLDRQTGTPIRAAMVVAELKRQSSARAVTLGGGDPSDTRLDGMWRRSDGGARLHFRLGRYTAACLRALTRLWPDVVHLFSSVPFPAAFLYRMIRPRTAVVTEFHGLFEHEMTEARGVARWTYAALDRWAARRSNGTVAMSGIMKEHLARAYGAVGVNCKVILGPVDLGRFPYRPRRRGTPLVAGYSGNASRWQGLDTVFEACRRLKESKAIQFVFTGFDPETVQPPSQSNVVFKGLVPPEQLADLVAGYDVFLSTRLPESASHYQYPSKISMALATGRPILASRIGEQARIVEEEHCGVLFEAGNVESLMEGLVGLPSMSDDEWMEMGSRGRAFAERELDLAGMASRLLAFYRRLGAPL